MGLLVPLLAFSQGAGPNSSQDTGGTPAVEREESAGGSGRVDESTLILGEPSAQQNGSSVSGAAFGFWDFVRMVLVLACVIGIIYLVFYLLKRAGAGKYAQSDLIRIVGSQTLPGNRAIYMIQVGPQVFMVGAGGDSVSMLGEITDKETVDAMILAAGAAEDAPRRNFGDLLSTLIKGGQDGSLDLMRQQRERLQRLRQ